jgi:hypothetical protein
MTRKQNILFVKAGIAGLSVFVAAVRINALIHFSGNDNPEFQAFAQAVLTPVAVVSFIFLGWFGIMPRAGTWMFLRGAFDNPQCKYMYTWPLHRFVFMVTDDPRVHAKERQMTLAAHLQNHESQTCC